MKKLAILFTITIGLIYSCSKEQSTQSQTKDISLKIARMQPSCMTKANNLHKDNNPNSNIEYINTDIQYNFRDNYLSKSVNGQKYIDYYYSLSDFVINYEISNNPERIFDVYLLLQKSIEIFSKLMNPSFKYVLIDNPTYQLCKKSIEIIKVNPNFSNIKDVVVNLEIDLENFNGKNVS